MHYNIETIGLVGSTGLALVLFLFFYDSSSKRSGITKQLYGWPVIGNAFDFASSRLLQTLRAFPKRYGKFVQFHIFFQKVLLVTDPVIIQEVLNLRPKRLRRNPKLDIVANIFQNSKGLFNASTLEEWGRLRRVRIAQLFIIHQILL